MVSLTPGFRSMIHKASEPEKADKKPAVSPKLESESSFDTASTVKAGSKEEDVFLRSSLEVSSLPITMDTAKALEEAQAQLKDLQSEVKHFKSGIHTTETVFDKASSFAERATKLTQTLQMISACATKLSELSDGSDDLELENKILHLDTADTSQKLSQISSKLAHTYREITAEAKENLALEGIILTEDADDHIASLFEGADFEPETPHLEEYTVSVDKEVLSQITLQLAQEYPKVVDEAQKLLDPKEVGMTEEVDKPKYEHTLESAEPPLASPSPVSVDSKFDADSVDVLASSVSIDSKDTLPDLPAPIDGPTSPAFKSRVKKVQNMIRTVQNLAKESVQEEFKMTEKTAAEGRATKTAIAKAFATEMAGLAIELGAYDKAKDNFSDKIGISLMAESSGSLDFASSFVDSLQNFVPDSLKTSLSELKSCPPSEFLSNLVEVVGSVIPNPKPFVMLFYTCVFKKIEHLRRLSTPDNIDRFGREQSEPIWARKHIFQDPHPSQSNVKLLEAARTSTEKITEHKKAIAAIKERTVLFAAITEAACLGFPPLKLGLGPVTSGVRLYSSHQRAVKQDAFYSSEFIHEVQSGLDTLEAARLSIIAKLETNPHAASGKSSHPSSLSGMEHGVLELAHSLGKIVKRPGHSMSRFEILTKGSLLHQLKTSGPWNVLKQAPSETPPSRS